MMTSHFMHNQLGSSSIQMAAAILVSTVILLGALGGYHHLNASKVDLEIQFINHLKLKTMSYGQLVKNFQNQVNLDRLNQFGFWNHPAVEFIDNNTVRNQWGGSIFVSSASRVLNTHDAIYFRTTNVPPSACSEFAGAVDRIVGAIVVNGIATKIETVNTRASTLASGCYRAGYQTATVELYINVH